jgi:hypothetical protein
MKFSKILFLLLFVFSCNTTQDNPDDRVYRKELVYQVNKKMHKGFSVVDAKSEIEVCAYIPKGIIKGIKRNCTGAEDIEIKRNRGRGKRDYFTFTVPRDTDLEGNSCHVSIDLYSEEGIHSFGTFEIKAKEKLPATLYCNWKHETIEGVGACQTKAGSLIKVTTSDKALPFTSDDCPEPQKIGVGKYTIKAKEGFCSYLFSTEDSDEKTFRLSTYGWNSVITRPLKEIEGDKRLEEVLEERDGLYFRNCGGALND